MTGDLSCTDGPAAIRALSRFVIGNLKGLDFRACSKRCRFGGSKGRRSLEKGVSADKSLYQRRNGGAY
ncbi:hypothetical protein IMY05_005G0161000 [Salix suchowensis]|nr:hypothetical protein IMY05_005G0161000 [Salix suchowensis]